MLIIICVMFVVFGCIIGIQVAMIRRFNELLYYVQIFPNLETWESWSDFQVKINPICKTKNCVLEVYENDEGYHNCYDKRN